MQRLSSCANYRPDPGALVSEEDLFQQYPAERLVAVADPLPSRVKK